MPLSPKSDEQSPYPQFFALLGIALILLGVGMLVYIVILAWTVFHDPGSVKLVQFMLEQIKMTDQVITGYAGDKAFEMRISQPVLYMSFLLINVTIIAVLTSAFAKIISAGIALVKYAGGKIEIGAKLEKSPSSPTPSSPPNHDQPWMLK